MNFGRYVQAAFITGVAISMMAASASAGTITFNTSATGSAGTGFNSSGNLTLNQTSGVAASLGFVPDPNATVGVPGNINYGNFTLTCALCTTQAIGIGSTFNAFTFDLVHGGLNREISFDWRRQELTFDVPKAATAIVYFFNYGSGHYFVRNVALTAQPSCAAAVTASQSLAAAVATGERLDFVPPIGPAHRLLAGYCGDATFKRRPVCQRLSQAPAEPRPDITRIAPQM